MKKNTTGYIYILTNPSFEEYVKIGYADNVGENLFIYNDETTIYATYEVNNRLLDKELHSIIDNLNPSLRSVDEVDGKVRKREFYALTPEQAYSLLEGIA
ncbi:MAG: GIY-YIG nuclease family protein, partial [Bacilli bacterium]